MAGSMVAYPQAKFHVCRDVVSLAQQQPFQHLSRSRFLLYARAEQPRHHRGHELNQVTSPVAAAGDVIVPLSVLACKHDSIKAGAALKRYPPHKDCEDVETVEVPFRNDRLASDR